jgi:hypothetical protein
MLHIEWSYQVKFPQNRKVQVVILFPNNTSNTSNNILFIMESREHDETK